MISGENQVILCWKRIFTEEVDGHWGEPVQVKAGGEIQGVFFSGGRLPDEPEALFEIADD